MKRMLRVAVNKHGRPARSRLVCLAALAIAACQGGCGSSPPAPSPPPTTAPPVIYFAGAWVGTIESANLPTRSITMTVVQAGNCVDGGWVSTDSGWSGAISGIAGTDSYSGQVSFERDDGSGHCTAIGTVSGPVGSNSLRWTGTGFTAIGPCGGDLPQSIVITLQRP